MLILKTNLRNQRMSKYNNPVIASISYGYLKLECNFMTDDWKSTSTKIANFSYRGKNYPRLIDENNQCEVPKEVIRIPSFTVSIFGGGITTNQIKYLVEDSGIDNDNATNTEYYNEIIIQLSAQIDMLNETKADDIVFDAEANTLQLTSNGSPIGNCCEIPVGDSCGIESFIVNENEEIIVTLTTGQVINLGVVNGASSAIFIPHISEDKILTWTNNGGLDNPEPVDLNPFDEWSEDGDINSEYEWEDE